MKKNFLTLLFVNFKTGFRAGIAAYWAAVFFVSPFFLFGLVPYAVFRLINLLTDEFPYDDWKQVMYGKSDKKLTLRKLRYFIQQGKQYGIRRASVYIGYDERFKRGSIQIDEHLSAELIKNSTFSYTGVLTFDGKTIGKVKGFSFRKFHCGTKAFPEIERALNKFLHNMEQDIQQAKKQVKKAEMKRKKTHEEAYEQQQKSLAKEIRKAYKKESSL